jgi:hypothetical protein
VRSQTKADARRWTDAAVGLRKQKTRESQAKADLLEIERLRMVGEITTISEVKGRLSDLIAGLRQQLLELPTACSYQANPNDPTLAAEVFREAITRILTRVCQELEETFHERGPRAPANRRRAPGQRRRRRMDGGAPAAPTSGNGVPVG